ncbi:MAG: L-cystine transporter tcyP [Pseudohongiella sp.]|nr:MAG: L-cystine transporter tcyP [Pseudohongiella sp.]
MDLIVIAILLVFSGLIFALFRLGKNQESLSRKVFAGLLGGMLFGSVLQLLPASAGESLATSLSWIDVVGRSYVNLLRMIIMPLILITMIAAVIRVEEIKSLGKIGGTIIAVLVGTTVIAALVGINVAAAFGLTSEGLVPGAAQLARAEVLENRLGNMAPLSIPDLLISFFPTNIFSDLSNQRDMSVIGVVMFGIIFGIAALLVIEESDEHGDRIKGAVATIQAVIMRLVRIVMAITPYGVLALMTKVVAGSDLAAIAELIYFVIASYFAIAIMFIVHGVLISLSGRNPIDCLRRIWPVLSFAFVTRSSAATIPLTIRAQIEELNIPAPIANMAASFGSTIGQNGCAGIYPAMLAVMVAPSVGVDPLNPAFMLSLVLIVAFGSFGIAGVGGGATNAALVVLPAVGFPITIVALLISIEPLIDMARTALNVNGSITAGVITNRLVGNKISNESDQQIGELANEIN